MQSAHIGFKRKKCYWLNEFFWGMIWEGQPPVFFLLPEFNPLWWSNFGDLDIPGTRNKN
jgi:hypothetical protein